VDIRLQEELRSVGDSHNINDPGFQSFQQQVLAQYGVASIDELPVNYRGLVSLQGEAESSAVMDRLTAEQHTLQRDQAAIVKLFALISPYIAVRHLSMTSAGTDLRNHQQFLDAAEAHRFALIQGLNTLHAEELDYADDSARSRDAEAEQRTRVSSEFWATLQQFDFTGAGAAERVVTALPLLLALFAWLIASAVLLRAGARKVEAL
jgi:ABC-2 type transport system permease protein